MDLKELQNRVELMLDGEKKRREVALKFVRSVTDTLIPIADDIFPKNDYCDTCAIFVKSSLYFRWDSHYSGNQVSAELPDFYIDMNDSGTFWGAPIQDIRGPRFWWIIRTIVEWIPEIATLIEKKEQSREKLLALLK